MKDARDYADVKFNTFVRSFGLLQRWNKMQKKKSERNDGIEACVKFAIHTKNDVVQVSGYLWLHCGFQLHMLHSAALTHSKCVRWRCMLVKKFLRSFFTARSRFLPPSSAPFAHNKRFW